MSEIFQDNIAIVQRRWPTLTQRLLAENTEVLAAELVQGQGSTLSIAGIQLTSRHDRLAEARLQAATLPAGSVQVHLYGTGLGDLQRVLLADPTLQRLCVYVLNGAIFALVMQLLEQNDWLSDPRVQLAYAGDCQEIALPFFALPAELQLADDFNAKIRDRLVSEVHLAFSNREFDARDQENQQLLEQGLELLSKDADVAELFGSQPSRDVFVIATGPSLQQHLPALYLARQALSRPLFICVDTAYRPLREHGIVPDIVVSIDHRITPRHLPGDNSEGIALVYFPRLESGLLAQWQGPRYVGYSPSPLYRQVREHIPKGELQSGGSVIHPALDLAVQMGASRVLLFGADFSFPLGRTHTGWQDGELGLALDTARHWVRDGHGERVRTQLNFRSYLIELERYIARHPAVSFFNTSRDGAAIAGTEYDASWTPQ